MHYVGVVHSLLMVRSPYGGTTKLRGALENDLVFRVKFKVEFHEYSIKQTRALTRTGDLEHV